jgi:hypothetical protein
MERGELTTREIGTNTINPQLGLFNLQQKKKPYDVKIKNFNPKEPKVKQNIKYSAKQNYRKYKSNVEPNLRSKIMIDEEDDMVNKIKKAFGMETTSKRNFTQTETNPLSSQGLGLIEPRLADDDGEVNRYAGIIENITRRAMFKVDRDEMTQDDAQEWMIEEFRRKGLSLSDVERIGNKIRTKRAGLTEEEREKQSLMDAEEYVKLMNERTPEISETLESEVFGDLTRDSMDEVLGTPVELFKPGREELEMEIFGAVDDVEEAEVEEAEVEAADLEEEPASPVSRGATTASLITTEAARESALTATGEFRGTPGRKPSTDPEKVAKKAAKIDKEEKRIKDEAMRKALEEEEAAKTRAKTSKP